MWLLDALLHTCTPVCVHMDCTWAFWFSKTPVTGGFPNKLSLDHLFRSEKSASVCHFKWLMAGESKQVRGNAHCQV